MTRAGRQGWRTEVCRDRTSSQTDRRQRGGRRTQCEAPISLRGRGDCKGERGVPLYPFTCPEVTFRHEHKVNGTHLPSRIFPSPQPSPRGRGRKPVVARIRRLRRHPGLRPGGEQTKCEAIFAIPPVHDPDCLYSIKQHGRKIWPHITSPMTNTPKMLKTR